jgi:hypothetical protein
MGVAVVPEPRSWEDVVVAPLNVLLVPYKNQALVSAPFGVTVPDKVADVLVIVLADPVNTVGFCTAVVVAKLRIAPLVVPVLF